eukprot:2814052-Prymnesium_polylepis.2
MPRVASWPLERPKAIERPVVACHLNLTSGERASLLGDTHEGTRLDRHLLATRHTFREPPVSRKVAGLHLHRLRGVNGKPFLVIDEMRRGAGVGERAALARGAFFLSGLCTLCRKVLAAKGPADLIVYAVAVHCVLEKVSISGDCLCRGQTLARANSWQKRDRQESHGKQDRSSAQSREACGCVRGDHHIS